MKWFFSLMLLVSFQGNADVSPEDVNTMIDQMVKNNVISAEEAEKAKLKMKSMSPDAWAQINAKAATIAARSPASAAVESNNKIEEVNGIDLESKQFKSIQDDMKKFVP